MNPQSALLSPDRRTTRRETTWAMMRSVCFAAGTGLGSQSSCAVVVRSRRDKTSRILSAIRGSADTTLTNALRGTRIARTSVTVRTVAERTPGSRTANSPNKSPAPSRAIVEPRFVTSAVPSTMMQQKSPGVSSTTISWPGLKRAVSVMRAILPSWRFLRSANNGTPARNS